MSSAHGHLGRGTEAFHHQGAGTVARATVDTTLAVIPAEAFKRLTKKFPNAAAHIVQVILARLSRVTFHTAHKYLGLTKEVMRTEKSINDLACFPLPSEFYEKGGMDSNDIRQSVQSTIKELANGLPSCAAGVGLVYAHPVARFELNFSLPLVLRKGEEGRKGVQFGVGIDFL